MTEEPPYRNVVVRYLKGVFDVISLRRSKVIILVVGTAYLLLYLLATGVLVVSSTPHPFDVQISEQWPALIFRQRTPFNWEPIGLLSLGWIQVFLAVPNIVFGLAIAALVGVNIAVSAYTYTARKVCRINPSSSILAAAPAFLTGIACCGPTLLLSLGIASTAVTVAFVAVLPVLLPLALIGLLGSMLWSGRKLTEVPV